jgi:glycosyltransferase involved in cell wall biosynthesis
METEMHVNSLKLRIAVIGIEPPEAGGAHNAENLMLSQIQEALSDHEVIVVKPNGPKFGKLWVITRLGRFFRAVFLIWKHNPATWSILRRLNLIPTSRFERKLLRLNIDLVFFVGSYDKAIELKSIPFIATVWDLGHRDMPSLPELGLNREFEFREWRIRNVLIKAHVIVVDSEVTRQKLGDYYGINVSKIYSLPFCPEAQELSPATERDSFAFYPAHYWSHKNHIVLLEAIASLVSRGEIPKQLKLTGLDKGNFQFLAEKVKEFGISSYVDFLGFVSKAELDLLYRKAAVMVMPSLLGPTNLPPLEALLRGCPVVVSSGARENLKNWPGVQEIEGSDIQAWSQVLNIKNSFEKVDSPAIQQQLFETKKLNVEKLTMIFEDFEFLRRTHK